MSSSAVSMRKPRRARKRGNAKGLARGLNMAGSSSQPFSMTSGVFPHFGRVQRMDNRPYQFSQSLNLGTLYSTSVTAPTSNGFSFGTGNISQFSNFAAIFDQYRFSSVEVWVVPLSSASLGSDSIGFLYSALDYDSAAPVTTTVIAQRTDVMVTTHTQGHYRRFVPHVAVAAYSGSAFTQFANEQAPWIDCISAGVQHYGLLVSSDITSAVIAVTLFVRINVEFRNVA